jgi:hypothetical protein
VESRSIEESGETEYENNENEKEDTGTEISFHADEHEHS